MVSLACGENRKSAEVRRLELSDLVVDTLFLEKDTLTKYLGVDFTHYATDSGEVLLTLNRHRLLTYSYPEGKILKSAKFETEGPDGIGSFIPGTFIDRSKIYLLSQDQRLLEADLDGKVLRRIPLPEAPPERLATNYSTWPFNPIFKSDSGLFISDVPLVLKESHLAYKNWVLDFSPGDSTYGFVGFQFPASAKNFLDDPELGQYYHWYDPSENSHWISFSASDSVLKIRGNESGWFLAKAEESLQFLRGTTSQQGEWTAFHPNQESGKYTAIQQDKATGLLFRHAKVKAGNAEQHIRSRHVFVVFNPDGEKVAEISFSDWDFSPYAFQTPAGIYVPVVAQLREDQVPYARLDFSKIRP